MESLDTLSNRASATDGPQYLTFRLGDEEYGIDVLKVQEIRSYAAITSVPNTPRAVKGVMNLRGQIVPVVDLRIRFGMAETEYGRFAVVIVVVIGGKVVGLLADSVSDVLTIRATEIQAAPDVGVAIEARLIRGMAKAEDRLLILLDVEHLLEGNGPSALHDPT